MIPGFKMFMVEPPAMPAKAARVQSAVEPNHSNNSDPSKGVNVNDCNTESLLERAAIQEYEGGLSRDRANMAAARRYDSMRPLYEQANPGEDPVAVEVLYEKYIRAWKPDESDPYPRCPPNTRTNSRLWVLFWKEMETIRHESKEGF